MQTTNVNKVLVSICIPVYNGESFLAESLNSCVDQSFKDYEIVICDDGSTDGSIAIIEDYQKKYPAIRFYKNEINLGLVGNWNKCLELAKGEWIKFVFQDDYISHDCLEQFVALIGQSSGLMVCERNFILPEHADSVMRDYYTKGVRTLSNTTSHRESFFPPQLICEIAVQNMCMNFIGEPSLSFFKKSLLSEYGLFNAELKQICDLEYLLRLASHIGLTYLPKKLCAFRIHNQSTTSSNIETKFYELKYIEPIVFAWILLYTKEYKQFRSQLSFNLKFILYLFIKVKTYRAYKVNLEQKRNHKVFDKMRTAFKELEAMKEGNLFIKLISRLV